MNTKHGIFLAMFSFLVFCAFIGTASADTIYVPDDYAKIQWAIDNTTGGDTIIVRDGTYIENVDVNKRLTIRSENGPANCIVHAADPDDDVFDVNRHHVNISGFTVTGATGMGKQAGIDLTYEDYCTVSNNNVSNNHYGIYLGRSDYNTITNNTLSNNSNDGICLVISNHNTIMNNNASNNNGDGIYLQSSFRNMITNNTVLNNKNGIHLYGGNYAYYSNTIMNNNASNNRYGIYLESYSNSNTLTNNNVSNNRYGIYLDDTIKNTILNNNASNNRYGIYLDDSKNNILTNNIMSANEYNFGIVGRFTSEFIHNIDISNKVDGKPIYYLIDEKNKQIPSNAGYVGIVNCTNITVNNLTLTNNLQGILLAYSSNSRIENVIVSNNYYGIYLRSSSNNTLTNNIASNNSDGIYLRGSNNTLTNNIASNNSDGIYLRGSKNTLTDNIASYNYRGIYLRGSKNTLTDNIASYNYRGIYLEGSNNTLTNNNAYPNKRVGIEIAAFQSERNKIYMNNFKGSTSGPPVPPSGPPQIEFTTPQHLMHFHYDQGVLIGATAYAELENTGGSGTVEIVAEISSPSGTIAMKSSTFDVKGGEHMIWR